MGYLGEIADHFIERRGGGLFLSHRDIGRILHWERQGIAPRVIKEVIDEVFEGLRGPDGKTTRKVRSLAYMDRLVQSRHRKMVESLTGSEERPEEPGLSRRILAGLPDLERRVRIAAEKSDLEGVDRLATRLCEELRDLAQQAERTELEQYDAVRPLFETLDRMVMDHLRASAPERVLEECQREAVLRLSAPPGARSTAVDERATQALAAELLRRHYGLPRIALYAVV